MKEFVAYFIDDDGEHKKAKRNKKVCNKDETYVKKL